MIQQQQLCTTYNGVDMDYSSVASLDVSAVCTSQVDWALGAETKAMALVDHLPQLVSSGQDTLQAYSAESLRNMQLEGRVLSRVISYVESRQRPTRRDRTGESAVVLRYLKQWDKLTMKDGILYRVLCDQLLKRKQFQYIVPTSLVDSVLRGIHDDSGHQGQFRSVCLAKQQFYWLNMEHTVRDYVRHCHCLIVSKSSDPSGKAPLQNILSTRHLELVCIDFWSVEDAGNKSIDVLVVITISQG